MKGSVSKYVDRDKNKTTTWCLRAERGIGKWWLTTNSHRASIWWKSSKLCLWLYIFVNILRSTGLNWRVAWYMNSTSAKPLFRKKHQCKHRNKNRREEVSRGDVDTWDTALEWDRHNLGWKQRLWPEFSQRALKVTRRSKMTEWDRSIHPKTLGV